MHKPTTPELRWRQVWSSREQSLAVLRLPRLVTRPYLEQLVRSLQQESASTATRLLDFSKVKHVEISGHQEFFGLAAILRDPHSDVSLLGMTAAVSRELAACRIMDVLGESDSGNPLSALSNTSGNERYQAPTCKSYMMGATGLVFLAGRVDGQGLARDRLRGVAAAQRARPHLHHRLARCLPAGKLGDRRALPVDQRPSRQARQARYWSAAPAPTCARCSACPGWRSRCALSMTRTLLAHIATEDQSND